MSHCFEDYRRGHCAKKAQPHHHRRAEEKDRDEFALVKPKSRLFVAARVMPNAGVGASLLPPGSFFPLGSQKNGDPEFYQFLPPDAVLVKIAGRYALRYMTVFSGGIRHRSLGIQGSTPGTAAQILEGSVFSEFPPESGTHPLWGECITDLVAGTTLRIVHLSDANGLLVVTGGADGWVQAFISVKKLRS